MNEENKRDTVPPELKPDQEAGTTPSGIEQQGVVRPGTGSGYTPAPPGPERPAGRSPLVDGGLTLREKIQRGPAAIIVASLCLFTIILSVYLIVVEIDRYHGSGQGQGLQELDPLNSTTLNMFYPLEGKVALEQRVVPRVTGTRAMAAVSVGEFLAGPSDGAPSYVPDAVELLGVYLGQDRVLYLDFSSAMTLNFQGDAVAEFLLLRALYKTLKENVYGTSGYRLLVDGKEVDTIGGHIYVLSGLERAVPYRLLEEDEIEE